LRCPPFGVRLPTVPHGAVPIRDGRDGAGIVGRLARYRRPEAFTGRKKCPSTEPGSRRSSSATRQCYPIHGCAPSPPEALHLTLEARPDVPHRAPGSSRSSARSHLSGRPIRYYRPAGSADVRRLVDEGFQAFNAARIGEACRIFCEKMLSRDHDTTIGLTVAGAMTPAGLGGCVIELMERGLVDFVISTGANLYHDLHYALNFALHRGSPFVDDRDLYRDGIIRIYDVLFPAQVLLDTDRFIRDFLVDSGLDGAMSTAEFHHALGTHLLAARPGCDAHSVVASAATYGVPLYTSSPGDSSIGMNVAYHELMNGSRLMIDPSRDVNEICAIILAGEKNGCVILGGGSPKNFYLQGQPTLWEVYGIPKGGNDYFIQITTDQVVWGGLSGATPAEAVSWGKVNPGVLPDTVVAYCDTTVALPLFCEYAVGHENGRRPRKNLVARRSELVRALEAEARRRARKPLEKESPAQEAARASKQATPLKATRHAAPGKRARKSARRAKR
jgi:deoxyhypusine synthase